MSGDSDQTGIFAARTPANSPAASALPPAAYSRRIAKPPTPRPKGFAPVTIPRGQRATRFNHL
ncbi:hypothetical protein ACIA5D_06855 [Actinoplanes sp. NPDC051513]|uniref:hypothetical protein n=1 Tax=Actinoplanes sp. NPDC051513 TaxID=3363908 RepID=UPI0037B334FE